MVVYLDVVWLLNLMIDFLLLRLTAFALKRQVKRWRLWLGALVASFIVFFLFTPLSPYLFHPLGKLLYSAVIVWTAFGYRRFSLYSQSFLTFYFVAFAAGGALFGVHYFIRSSQYYDDWLRFSTFRYGDPVGWALVIIGFPLVWRFSKKRLEHVAIRKWEMNELMAVAIVVAGKTIAATGMVDTGNRLNDPVRNLPVMFVNRELLRDWLPERLLAAKDPARVFLEEGLEEEWMKRLAVVPYSSVNGRRQLALAFKPDRVEISHPQGTLFCTEVLVALAEQRLSETDDFACLLHPDMIQRGQAAPSLSS